MGTIVVHAGMHKTGSSSIQKWLRDHGERLRADSGIAPLSAKMKPSGEVRLVVNRGKMTMNSWAVRAHCDEHPEHRERVASELCARLDRKAGANAAVVLSAEAFSHWLTSGDELFLGALNELAGRHSVLIACYVRPQHAALESAWRSRGYRSGLPPSRFLEDWGEHLHYRRAVRRVREIAPALELTPRPFRRDLLEGGNVVVDFARKFLGLEVSAAEIDDVWRNRGLPLALANAMQGAPAPAVDDRSDALDPHPIGPLRRLAERLELGESEDARRSRLVLQQACHVRYEDENRELIRELGWATDSWVPVPDDAAGGADGSFEPLDDLWRPRASAAELALIHRAVAELGAARSGDRGAAATSTASADEVEIAE